MSTEAKWWTGAAVALLVLIVVSATAIPAWNVWRREMKGKAMLREAEWERQVQVEDARGQREAAILLSERDSIQALGPAAANRILGESLSGESGERYLVYLWLQGLHDGNSEVIYVPTEANLPIMEAGRTVLEGR